LDAFCCPRRIVSWCGYTDVANEIRQGNYCSILDVGSGGSGISDFINSKGVFILLSDRNASVFKGASRTGIDTIVCDGCNLPFEDNRFDVVVSVEAFHQVSKDLRASFLKEVSRVAKKLILLTQATSSDGLYNAKYYSIKYQEARSKYRGIKIVADESYFDSHMVTVDEIKEIFPNATFLGRKNGDIYLKYATLSMVPIVGFFTGLIYYLFWKRRDNKPPFLEVMVVK
jgi:ubiquinone/menaquinone biosynthesis C-methylase UbiE